MSAGGGHVCGLSDDHEPNCWEWPGLALPKGLDFSIIALGQNFLCGVDKTNGTAMRCYGGTMPPPPAFAYGDAAYKAVAAGRRHACAVDAMGGLVCWGDGNPDGNHLVFNSTLPGACTNKTSCQCDVVSGSGALCGTGGGVSDVELAVCQPCTIPLNASRIVVANGRTPTPGNNGKNKNALVVGLSAAGAGVAVLAAVGLTFYLVGLYMLFSFLVCYIFSKRLAI
ncbi:hypothetical protein QYE76_062243 [Lolium multiflorum]|uniref:Uncharacterized protein n=1 Tax=Lolium multiflorum TaxID=4521 RepID=A0AAD8S3N2_LOLMU|nr:hypothetical protein QYE76_062243 [Lolium multiflorum]